MDSQAIISFGSLPKYIIHVNRYITGRELYHQLISRYGLQPSDVYIIDKKQNKHIPYHNNPAFSDIDTQPSNNKYEFYLDVRMRLPGGGIMKRIFKSIFKAIFSVFQPIIKPLQAIANAFLLLIKAIIYIIALAIWFFKLLVWFFVQFLPSLPFDLILLIKQLVVLMVSTVIETISQILKRIVNWFGQQTVYSMSSGWDNARNSTIKSGTSLEDSGSCTKHCYRAPDGSIPFSIVIVTVLCPPVGVFMEYGLTGWLKILICFLLTLAFYFPGLIYALLLLYC